MISNHTSVLMHGVKMNRGYASIFKSATQPEQKSRYVDETSRVDSLFIKDCSGSVMITFIIDLYF